MAVTGPANCGRAGFLCRDSSREIESNIATRSLGLNPTLASQQAVY